MQRPDPPPLWASPNDAPMESYSAK